MAQSADDRSARLFHVSGRVQGVFFRARTQDAAVQLGLTGYARNLPDGRVEVLACGPVAALRELEKWLHTGPRLARVTTLTSEDAPFQQLSSFTTG